MNHWCKDYVSYEDKLKELTEKIARDIIREIDENFLRTASKYIPNVLDLYFED